MKILHVITRFVIPGPDRESRCHSRVSLNVVKCLALLFALMLSLSACTDYEADYEDMYGYMVADCSDEDSLCSSNEESSSGNASSSSAKSSSSVVSSSSVASSNSAISYGTLTDLRDNQTYKTVTIGTQTWMAENLNYAYNEPTSSLDSSSFCYNNSADSCAKYGRLYLWSAAMDTAAVFSTAGKGCGYGKTCSASGTIRGVCPEGWHLPSKDEWNTLFTKVGGTGTAGTMLKSTSGWNNSGNGVDSFGFSVLPAGNYYSYYDSFYSVGDYARFWSSSEYNSSNANLMRFYYNHENVYAYDYYKYDGFSVRCLRDSKDEGGTSSSSYSVKSSSSLASSSSSSVIPSSSQNQQSSSNAKSSSSVASSSSAKSSSSVVSSSSIASSSSAISYGTLTDSRDNQTYKTVTIGTQTWMAENLNYDYNEGTAKSYCYNNSADSCAKYGRLYLWSAAMDSAAVFSTAGKGCGYGNECSPSGTVRGVCPEGWHLPSYDEWNTLFTAVGGTGSAGRSLKSTSGWNDGGNGDDTFGFSVLPAGDYNSLDDDFYSVGYYAGFWSSTEYSSSSAYSMSFSFNDEHVYVGNDYKRIGFSVRCLRD